MSTAHTTSLLGPDDICFVIRLVPSGQTFINGISSSYKYDYKSNIETKVGKEQWVSVCVSACTVSVCMCKCMYSECVYV